MPELSISIPPEDNPNEFRLSVVKLLAQNGLISLDQASALTQLSIEDLIAMCRIVDEEGNLIKSRDQLDQEYNDYIIKIKDRGYIKREVVVNSLDELISTIESLRSHTSYLFRGQCNSTWPLVPSISRSPRVDVSVNDLNYYKKLLEDEQDTINRFRYTVKHFVEGAERELVDAGISGDSNHMALTVMQHFGAPTRILDWTRNPYIACYFATAQYDGADSQSVSIFWLDEWALYNRASRQWHDIDYEKRRIERRIPIEELMFREDCKKFISPWYPYKKFQKIFAQDSVFTVAGRIGHGQNHDELINEIMPEEGVFGKIVIPRVCDNMSICDEIQRFLAAFKINARTLDFCFAEGFAARLAERRRLVSIILDHIPKANPLAKEALNQLLKKLDCSVANLGS